MTAQVEKRPYFGLNFTEAVKLKHPVPSTMTIDYSTKLSLKGSLCLDFHRNSYRYNNEAVLSVWAHDYPVVKHRSKNSNWGRNEIVLPISVETRDFFLECAYEVDARLKGVK